MTVLAHSLTGTLRLRALNSKKSVVEIRSHLYPGEWTYCVWRSLPAEEAHALFYNQAQCYCDPSMFTQPVVQPGV